MTLTIEVRFHPIYELLNSLFVFSDPPFNKKTEMGVNWRKSVQKKLSKSLLDDLTSPIQDRMDLLYGYFLTQPVSDLSIDQLLEELFYRDEKEVIKLVQKQRDEPNEKMECFEGTLQPAIQLIKKWKAEYFDHLDPSIISTLEQDCLVKNQLLHQYLPLDFVEKVTKGFVLKDFDDLEKIIVYPSYHTSPIVTFAHYQHLHFYGYPVELHPLTPEEPTTSLVQKGITLSDKNRLKILRFLGNEERSFTDIVNYIGLAKSTVHHHMIQLRASGLVQIILSPTTTDRYRLREQGLENIYSDFQQYFFPEK
jgi:DNA-binding transcriptional ArsR family regulator